MLRILISFLLILSLTACGEGGNGQLYLRKTVEGVHAAAKFANGNIDLGALGKTEGQSKVINGIYQAGVSAAHYFAPGAASTCAYVLEKGTGWILKCMDKNKIGGTYYKSISGLRLSDAQAEKQSERLLKRKLKKGLAKLDDKDLVIIKFKVQVPEELQDLDIDLSKPNPDLIYDDGNDPEDPPLLQFR